MSSIENPYLLGKYQVAFSTDALNGNFNKKNRQELNELQHKKKIQKARKNRGEQKKIIDSFDASFEDWIKKPDLNNQKDQRAWFTPESWHMGTAFVKVPGQTAYHEVYWHCPDNANDFRLYYKHHKTEQLIPLDASNTENLKWA